MGVVGAQGCGLLLRVVLLLSQNAHLVLDAGFLFALQPLPLSLMQQNGLLSLFALRPEFLFVLAGQDLAVLGDLQFLLP